MYAVQLGEMDSTTRERVWLMGVVPDRRKVAEILSEFEIHAQRERNSLVAVASKINDVAKAIFLSEHGEN
jgi:hypothetical protein